MDSTHNKDITWHLETLPYETFQALDIVAKQAWMQQEDWYLAGGTALALHAGHRQSVDLDFFSPGKTFPLESLLQRFKDNNWRIDVADKGTLYGLIGDAKVSYIAYPFFQYTEAPKMYGNIRILMPADIAVMKIIAISQRGRKRDFIDLFWYAQNYEPLINVLKKLPLQYSTVAHNYHHILESLMYFADAEDDPWPKTFFQADWKTVRTYFQKETPRIAKELLQLEDR